MAGRECTDAVATWLRGRGPFPGSSAIRDAGLAAYAYTVLPEGHPERAALHAEHAAALDRQARTRADVAPLVAAWRAAGLDVLPFGAFAIAELVGERWGLSFDAVDVLVRPEDLSRAEAIARREGWRSDLFVGRVPMPGAHSVCRLVGPAGGTQVVLHGLAVAGGQGGAAITRAVWGASRERGWGEAGRPTVRVAAPVDLALIGVLLPRVVGGDRWRVRGGDLAALRVLEETAGVDRAALLARAGDVGCSRTVLEVLARVEDLAPGEGPTGGELRRLDGVARGELGVAGGRGAVRRVLRGPGSLAAFLAVAGDVWRVRGALARYRDVRELLAALTVPVAGRGRGSGDEVAELTRVFRGVAWGVRLLPPSGAHGAAGACLYASLALFGALRRRGWAARFVSGVRRERVGEGEGETIAGHAWVEVDGGRVLDVVGTGEGGEYTVTMRHPEAAEPGRAG